MTVRSPSNLRLDATEDRIAVLEEFIGQQIPEAERKMIVTEMGLNPDWSSAYTVNAGQQDTIIRIQLTEERSMTAQQYAVKLRHAIAGDDRFAEMDVAFDTGGMVSAALNYGASSPIDIEIDSKNDYEYVIFEDLKAAGVEAVDLQSGYTSGGLGAYVEFRDERVAFFLRTLSRGKHSVSYRVRAEIPGRIHNLLRLRARLRRRPPRPPRARSPSRKSRPSRRSHRNRSTIPTSRIRSRTPRRPSSDESFPLRPRTSLHGRTGQACSKRSLIRL
jgi:hypothetical protein